MTAAETHESSPRNPLRLWPGVVLAVLMGLARFVLPTVFPETVFAAIISGVLGTLLIVLWWAFFSRAPHLERWGALALMVLGFFVTSQLVHVSIATGMMGMMPVMFLVPTLGLALVAGAVAGRHLARGPRRLALAAAILLACAGWTLVRTGGMTGGAEQDFAWRWSATPEERLLAQAGNEATALPATLDPAETGASWPGFRGPHRDGHVAGVQIQTDWAQSPPVELWRRPVGPGWSSFAVRGDLLYTQEQRGDNEVVACYQATNGEPVWMHEDEARFWESIGGAGPRGTPTLSGDRVYTLGATGILNVLNASDGSAVWSRNVVADTGVEVPGWGFAGSPLVVDDLVIVAAAGKLVAYDLATGEPRWQGPTRGMSYSSPDLVTLGGVSQVLLLTASGMTSVAPADGATLWEHSWPGDSRCVQPALTSDGDVLLGSSFDTGVGMRRIAVEHGSDGWTTQERWTSTGLKPFFNDFVVHKGYAYGFDGRILACVDVANGERKWKGGRYGAGQLLLLPDQDLLLVISEQGDMGLVQATPEGFTELARLPAIKGKTWNHPVLAGDLLLVRNAEEMAAFRLTLARRAEG